MRSSDTIGGGERPKPPKSKWPRFERVLADAGADANMQDNLGTTALMLTVQRSVAPRTTNGCTIASETLRALIAAGSDLDATDNHGNTALQRIGQIMTIDGMSCA